MNRRDGTTPTPLQQAALWAQILFYAITAVSIAAAGLLGIIKYRLFRFGRPFITVSLEVSSRPCSESHTQVGVTAKLYNGSRVLAKADVLEWECRGLATYDDEAVDEKIVEYFCTGGGYARFERGNSEFPWNVQQRIKKIDLDIGIEPNETSNDNVTFIVPDYCTAVQIRLFIPDKVRKDWGWTAVAYHSINATPKQEEP